MFLHHTALDLILEHSNGSGNLVDTKGASRVLGVSESWLNKLRVLKPEESPRYIKAGRRVLYRVSDLMAWQEARARGGHSGV